MRPLIVKGIGVFYRLVAKPILFHFDPESVHNRTVQSGEKLGRRPFAKKILSSIFSHADPRLSQKIFNLNFKSPIGLAAGFDYEARLTGILPALGFGFGSAGSLTHLPYEGNPRPMLGRLPRSRSLMVNKGFKNLGVATTLAKFRNLKFDYPVGVSIGKTNNLLIKTQEEAVADVTAAFRTAENSGALFSYYELNISCPNLKGGVEFYEPARLEDLVRALSRLNLKRPVFVKMPISNTDAEILSMMRVIVRYPFIKAVIIGNLEKNRKNPALVPEEVAKFSVGNWSGLPCRGRSDELIGLVYKNFGSRIRIIGCGGIFSAADAYRKIKLGASLVQLITGLIYEGPQLVAKINQDLPNLLRADGYKNISDAIGRGM